MERIRGRILRKDFGRIRGRILAEGKKDVYEIKYSSLLRLVSVFKRPKNREDSSKFDDFWTKGIVSARPVKFLEKCSKERNERKVFEKFQKKNSNKNFVGFSLDYIRDASLIALCLRFLDSARRALQPLVPSEYMIKSIPKRMRGLLQSG